ncbi:MAG: hypothetical protein IPG04_29200 [Polyangiaceae bacterium]|nr:hypothetical protein [Polyangiaceae bacterium]
MSAAPQTPFGDRPELERGLLRSIHRSPAKLLDKAQRAALAEVLPWLGLDTLVLRGATKKAKALGEVEALAWTPTLWWYDCQLDDAGVEAFVGSERPAPPVLLLSLSPSAASGFRHTAALRDGRA